MYLAGTCNFGLPGSRSVSVNVNVVDVGRVESGDNDCDGDEGLSGGVDVLSRHCHRCTATTSRHEPFTVSQLVRKIHRVEQK